MSVDRRAFLTMIPAAALMWATEAPGKVSWKRDDVFRFVVKTDRGRGQRIIQIGGRFLF